MDLLKKEMEKKKKALELAKQQQKNDGFLRASDVRRIEEQEQERREEEARKRKVPPKKEYGDSREDTSSSNKRVKKNKDQDENNNRASSTLSTLQTKSALEITQQLRALGLPVRLFAESDSQRLDRLVGAIQQQQSAMAGQSEMEEFRLGRGHGIRNPFLGNQQEEEAKETTRTSQEKSQPTRSETKKEKDNDDNDTDDPHKRIHRFFKGLLREWEDDLAQRPDAVKRTAAGKNETKTLKQCKDYIRPLFKLCKTRRLEPTMMDHILKIVNYCQEGEFVKAHDAYMDVAIGRAAWPIGVTMVGIHARTGRSKIESSNVAHVMNSELQRKYLTSVKRLMSYCQAKRKDVAPSKKVMN